MEYSAEYRRCLLEVDVDGVIKLWAHTNPNLPQPTQEEARVQIHIARVEAKSMPANEKQWSLAWLAEHGYRKIDGSWMPFPHNGYADAVGISSQHLSGRVLPLNRKIMDYMRGALLNQMAKGVTEPEIQKEAMLAARSKVRFKERLD